MSPIISDCRCQDPAPSGGAFDLGEYLNFDTIASITVDSGNEDLNVIPLQQMSVTNPSATDSMLVIVSFTVPSIGFDVTGGDGITIQRGVSFDLGGSPQFVTSVRAAQSGNVSTSSRQYLASMEYSGRIILTPAQSIFAEITDFARADADGFGPATVTTVGNFNNGWRMHATGWVLA